MFSSELVSQIKSAKATLIEKFRNVHFEMCAAEFKKANQYREGTSRSASDRCFTNREQ